MKIVLALTLIITNPKTGKSAVKRVKERSLLIVLFFSILSILAHFLKPKDNKDLIEYPLTLTSISYDPSAEVPLEAIPTETLLSKTSKDYNSTYSLNPELASNFILSS